MTFQRLGAFVFVSFLLALPVLALAQNFDPRTLNQNSRATEGLVPCTGVNCTCKDLGIMANRVLTFSIYIMIFISALTFSYAGLQYLTAGGDSGKITRSTSMLKNVAKGLGLALVAWLIVDTIVRTIGNFNFSSTWSQLCG